MFSALVTADAPAAHARWGHELDLGVRTASGWIGFGLAHRSTHPSAFVVERRLGLHAVKSTIVRIRKHFQSPGPATIRGCDVADYEIDGDDVTRKVTNGGYSMTGLEVGDTTIEVTVRGVPWSFGLRDQGGCERSRPRRAHAAVHQLTGRAIAAQRPAVQGSNDVA